MAIELTHPHHDDVADHSIGRFALSAQSVLDIPKLTNDLCSGQVAAEALVAG